MSSLVKRIFGRLPMSQSTRSYDFLSEYVTVPPSARLLDLGTGSGSGAAYLSRHFSEATILGLDLSFEELRLKDLLIGSTPPAFIQANALSVPLESASLDGIMAVMAFHCLPNPQQILSEAARTLRSGGWMVIADINGSNLFARPFEWFEHLFISPLTHAYTIDEYRTLMSTAGLINFHVEQRSDKKQGFMLWAIAYKP